MDGISCLASQIGQYLKICNFSCNIRTAECITSVIVTNIYLNVQVSSISRVYAEKTPDN